MTHYPQIRVEIRSPNPLALVAAVRHELRHESVELSEIRSFSNEAMRAVGDRELLVQICRRWVSLDPAPDHGFEAARHRK